MNNGGFGGCCRWWDECGRWCDMNNGGFGGCCRWWGECGHWWDTNNGGWDTSNGGSWERANANIETYPYNKEYSPNKANCSFIALSLRPNIAVIGANNGG